MVTFLKYLFLCLPFLPILLNAQLTSDISYPIAFYNVENLFDTERDMSINDQDFTPEGKYNWTEIKYNKKLDNLAKVIALLGREKNKEGFAILGIAEVENRKVLNNLVAKPGLQQNKYKIIHQDSPDPRGIDVALIYNPRFFKVSSYKVYPLKIPGNNNIRTRDILVTSGLLNGEPLSVLVNHWPSRRDASSSALRERAAAICKRISDSIYTRNPQEAIIIMGDMNDDPKDKSTSLVLDAKKEMSQTKKGGLFNTMWKLHDAGIGSLRYRDQWNLFDQIIISQNLLTFGQSRLQYAGSEIFVRDFMIQKSGRYKGYPLRTFSGTTFVNGYSDHFPTLIYLKIQKK